MPYGQGSTSRYLRGGYNQNSQNDYAAGVKRYGPFGARDNPTSGPVDKQGYRERDSKAQAQRNAMLRRLQAQQRGEFASADYLRPQDNMPALSPLDQLLGWYQ